MDRRAPGLSHNNKERLGVNPLQQQDLTMILSSERPKTACASKGTPTVYIHTYLRTYIHTYVQNNIHNVYIHTTIHTYVRSTYTHTYIHTHIYIHTYVRTYMHTYIHTYKTTHTYIHTYICIYHNINFVQGMIEMCVCFSLKNELFKFGV